MDDLFREIVDYQRRVVEVGGFWQIEDEIAEQEESRSHCSRIWGGEDTHVDRY